MENCPFCGTELPLDARFCGHCGRMQHATPAINKTVIDQQTQFSQKPDEEDEDERRRRAILPDFALPIGPMGVGQPSTASVPLVQGTPQASSVPLVQGTPSLPAGSSPPIAFVHGEAPSAPSSFSSLQAPSPAPPQTGQQPWQMHVSQPPPHAQPVTSPPYHPEEPLPHHVREPHTHQTHHRHKLHHTVGSAPKMVGGSVTKWLSIGLIGIVVIGAGGAGFAIYLLNRPQPAITINSDYTIGATPAGTSGTILHVIGNKFSGTSTIIFLLDGAPVPGNQGAHSDTQGNVRADLAITRDWAVGRHTLTAKDASGNTTKSGVTVMIVPQGQAHTPGPFGAPPDDASFTLNLSIQSQVDTLGTQSSRQATLIITGHADPSGGSVCKSRDNQPPQVYQATALDTGKPYTDTYTLTCSGSYKGGKITFTETYTSDVIVFTTDNPPTTCTLNRPYVDQQLTGSYTDHHVFSGTISFPGIPRSGYTCNTPGSSFFIYAEHGTWTGQIAS